MSDEKVLYRITLKNDKTLKQFFERYYVLPKDLDYTAEQREFLKDNEYTPVAEETKAGLNGYIVFRGKRPKKLNIEQIEEIQESTLSYRKLAEKYNVSIGTISRVKNNKY